jgi:hypothetical protein
MSEEILRSLALQVRNWGTWGPDDELGTLNYITPEAIVAAARLATTGKVFALGIPAAARGPAERHPAALQAHRRLDARPPDRRGGQRQLRRRGPALGNRRVPQPLPPGGQPEHEADPGPDLFLEELASDCAADGRYAFLLVAPPLPVTRGVGTPINPYAIK